MKLWLAPKQLSPDGNELITFRPVVGNTPGFSTPTTAGGFYLAGANLQRASIYVVELPSKENLEAFVGKEDTWIYDDKGPDSNPSNIVEELIEFLEKFGGKHQKMVLLSQLVQAKTL